MTRQDDSIEDCTEAIRLSFNINTVFLAKLASFIIKSQE